MGHSARTSAAEYHRDGGPVLADGVKTRLYTLNGERVSDGVDTGGD